MTASLSSFTVHEAWQMVVDQLRLQLNRNDFNAYIRDSRATETADEGQFWVIVPGEAARDWARSRLTSTAQRQLAPLVGHPVQVRFLCPDEVSPPTLANAASQPQPEPAITTPSTAPRRPRLADEDAHGGANGSTNGGAISSAHSDAPGTELGGPANGKAAPGLPGRSQPLPRRSVLGNAQIPHAPLPESLPTPDQAASAQAASRELRPAAAQQAATPAIPVIEDEASSCAETLVLEEVADTLETALLNPGRVVAFPRYELRHIAWAGPEAFFLRLAFLQECYLHTPANGRGQPFETSVESLLQWAHVGRATLHRFKKGDAGRGQPPAAGWFGIEQLPSPRRGASAQQQPPCRYRLQQGIPLTPMDADRLYELLIAAGVQRDPLAALQTLLARPVQELLVYPSPAPGPEHKGRAPSFTTVAGVVQSALGRQKLAPELREQVQECTARLSDHVTMPQQKVLVSWYFLQEWLPLLGHDAAALVLYTRAQGYYNPQDQELRDEITITGGYSELARAIGLKRDRTIGDWLPNLFDRAGGETAPSAESEKWQREQQRQRQAQETIARFVQVLPGSRKKTAAGHYAFNLHVEIKGEPLTPADRALRRWVDHTLGACDEAGVLGHFRAWVQVQISGGLSMDGAGILGQNQNDGVGILGDGQVSSTANGQNDPSRQNDVWGILGLRREIASGKMTGGESDILHDDGWGILESILDDGWGILAAEKMTARELFKGLRRLNTFWKTRLEDQSTTQAGPPAGQRKSVVVGAAAAGSMDEDKGAAPEGQRTAAGVAQAKALGAQGGLLPAEETEKRAVGVGVLDEDDESLAGDNDSRPALRWDLRAICRRSGGVSRFREQVLARESSPRPFLSWLLYAYSFKGRGIADPVGWALARLHDQPGSQAEGVFNRLAALPPQELVQLLRQHLEYGTPPAHEPWRFAFRDAPIARMKELADVLGVGREPNRSWD